MFNLSEYRRHENKTESGLNMLAKFREFRGKTGRLPDYLPWAGLIAPGVILQKDRVFQKTLEFRGFDLDSSSRIVLIAGVERINESLRRLGTGWAFHCEAQRFRSKPIEQSQWQHSAAEMLDEERREYYDAQGRYESRYYLTFSYKVQGERMSKLEDYFFGRGEGGETGGIRKDLEYFQEEVRRILKVMEKEFSMARELDDEETLTYLHSTISTRRHKISVPDVPFYLDAVLPDMPLSIGDTMMLGDFYIPTCSFTAIPAATVPGILDELNDLGIEYRWVTRFLCLSKQDAVKELNKYWHKWWWGRKSLMTFLKDTATNEESSKVNMSSLRKSEDAQLAMDEAESDVQAFGYFTGTVSVWHEDREEAARRMKAVIDIITGNHFAVKEEKFNNLYAWLGSLPGNNYPNVRRPIIGTKNLAHMMPLSAIWTGEGENSHLKAVCGVGTPHMFCTTAKHTTFRLNLNVGDVGHTTIFGSTGAGKSTLTNMLALQHGRYPGSQVIIFDKDRSARCATLAVEGQYYEPGKAGQGLSFQPLAYTETLEDQSENREFLLALLEAQHVQITPDIRSHIEGGLQRFGSIKNKRHRTLLEFCRSITDETIKRALSVYTKEGAYGSIFDGDEDGFRDGSWHMIEMGTLLSMGAGVIEPALKYLFRRIERKLDGSPTLIVLDEAWIYLKHERFANEIEKWLKTLRKKNAYVVFSTQEIHDAMKSSIMQTIINNCKTGIYLPDKKAQTAVLKDSYKQVGLTDEEITKLSRAIPKEEYFLKNEQGGRLFSMNLGRIALAIAGASSPKDHQFMDWMESNVHPSGYFAELLNHYDFSKGENIAKEGNREEEKAI